MTLLFGNSRLSSSDYTYVRNMDQQLVYEAAQQYVAMANEQANDAISMFVNPEFTTVAKERYQLGMTGRMQRVSEQTSPKPVTRSGSWDVAYPLDTYLDAIAKSDIDTAYMTPAELQQHVDDVLARANAAKRRAILYRILNNTQDTFQDNRLGSLTIEPLANNDSVVYPPVEGSESEASEDHYLVSGYTSANISDTNNPYKTLVDDLVHHGMNETADIPIAAMIYPTEQTKTESLTNFVPYIPPQIAPGNDTDQVLMPARNVPGKIIGYIRGLCWVSVWNWVPAGYIVGVNLASPQPLKMRVDPPETGLGNGGVVMLPEERHGVMTWDTWRLRFGIGASNRLSAAVMELTTDGTYSIPSGYASL